MNKIKIINAKHEDLKDCARILREIYNSNVLNEGWTEDSSNAICEFFFKLQPDLFYVAKHEGGGVIGFTFSYVKPWANGNQLMIEEISVDKNYRKQKVATNLLKTLLRESKAKYNVVAVNGTTYLGENDMPYKWYKRIHFKKVDDLFLIEGDTDDILNSLDN